ncbi:alanine--tRNA ligase, mitochondrial-like [Styela clava]
MTMSSYCVRRCLVVRSSKDLIYTSRFSMSSYEIRKKFIDFFHKQHNHEFISSSSVKLLSDPSLLFVNAGMNQFKPKILDTIDPNDKMSSLRRAVNSQKCIRAGGKHNDLQDVGKDTSHHTFFEMLGSWSFGDYFKEKACEMALELLTEQFKLPVDRLYFTYFGGDDLQRLDTDTSTRDVWKSLGVPSKNILPFGFKDNFWEMGDKGPCGPCTEIHYDYAGNGRDLVNAGHSDVVEIWNLVFMQYNRISNGDLVYLPTNHVDTGMGLERITAILQNKKSNYDTDLFLPILNQIGEICNCPKYQGTNTPIDEAYRIVSDHIRMLVVAISDHVYPGNAGAELILRRVLRRAYLKSKQILHAPDGLLCELVPIVVGSLSSHYLYMKDRQIDVIRIIRNEEDSFINVLKKGEKIFNKAIKNISKEKNFPMETAILLYNHYGYPIELIINNLNEKDIVLDIDEFNRYQEGREELKQSGREIENKQMKQNIEITSNIINDLRSKNIPATDAQPKYITVRNNDTRSYNFPSLASKLLCVISSEGKLLDTVEPGLHCALVFDKSSFYYTDGGQVADKGSVDVDNTEAFSILDVTYAGGYIFHHGYISRECMSLKVGDEVKLSLNPARRQACMRAHTATHIINHAWREIIGSDIIQQGSKVDEDSFRLTLNGPTPTRSQLNKILQVVRTQILSDGNVVASNIALNDALDDGNIRRLTDNIYSDPARIISIGKCSQNNHSVELCGGTHVQKTGDIGQFVILSCKSQGLNRTTVKCLTGRPAEDSESCLKDVQTRVCKQVDENKKLLSENDISVTTYKEIKKQIGQLYHEVISADISTICKSDMQAKLRHQSQQLSTKIKRISRKSG